MGLVVDALPWGNPSFLPLLVLVAAIALVWLVALRSRRSTLPVPKCSLPLVGATFHYLSSNRRRRFFEFLRDQQRDLGPLFNLNIFGLHVPVLADAREARRMVTDNDLFYRCDDLQRASFDVARYALFMLPSGATWKLHRKLIQPAFAPSNIRKVFPASVRHADAMLAIWEEKLRTDPDATVDLHDCFQRVTLDIIGDVALGGHQFDSIDALKTVGRVSDHSPSSKGSVFDDFDRLITAAGNRFGLPQFLWGLSHSSQKDIAPAGRTVQELARAMIDKRQRELDGEVAAGVVREKKDYDVMDRVLTPNSDRELLSVDEIVDEVIGFVLAGHETSSNTTTFAMWHLMENREKLDVLVEEILRVVGPVAHPTAEHLKDMPYLDAVFKESMRLKSPVPVIQRTTKRPTLVCGHRLPAESKVLIHVAGIHRDPALWSPRPDAFVPERWEDKVRMSDLEAVGAYMPFGGGQHVCIGMKLAVPEVKILMIRILQKFDPSLRPGQDFSWTVDGLTSGFRQGVHTHLRPRHQATKG